MGDTFLLGNICWVNMQIFVCMHDALSLYLVHVYVTFCCVIILLSDDSEETREFIASVFQPVQLGCERYVELIK